MSSTVLHMKVSRIWRFKGVSQGFSGVGMTFIVVLMKFQEFGWILIKVQEFKHVEWKNRSISDREKACTERYVDFVSSVHRDHRGPSWALLLERRWSDSGCSSAILGGHSNASLTIDHKCQYMPQVSSSNLIHVSSSCVISRVADSEQQTYSGNLYLQKRKMDKKPFAKRFVHLAVKKVSILYSTYTLYSAGQAGALWRQLCIRNNACCVAGTLYNP